MAAVVVIPARFGSTRFPGKIIAADTGKPLVQHVVDQVRQCAAVEEVIVATDDARIVAALAPFETRCVMTLATHVSGTDRVAEVARTLPGHIRWIVNVQGDEPEIEPGTISAIIDRLTSGAKMATAATRFPVGADIADPNLVKLVMDGQNRAIYFSRSVIPFARDSNAVSADKAAYYLHQGIYGYARDFLLQFSSWKPTPLELAEKLEQLRVLEHGKRIDVVITQRAVHGIDTEAQYRDFVKRKLKRET